jgi:DNA-directed RNA polymerase subunit N (RpoN/RPB10)
MTRVGNLFDIRYVFSPFSLTTGEWSVNDDLGVRRYKCSRLENER